LIVIHHESETYQFIKWGSFHDLVPLVWFAAGLGYHHNDLPGCICPAPENHTIAWPLESGDVQIGDSSLFACTRVLKPVQTASPLYAQGVMPSWLLYITT
jgi:hypothetical protein